MKTSLSAIAIALLIFAAMLHAQSPSHPATQTNEAPMSHASGPFDVKITPQDDKLNDGISRMVSEKQYHGDMEGSSKGQLLATGSAKSSGVYVAIETFTGTLHGKTGGFALHHTGIMTKGSPSLAISVVPDSGTGQLAGISGKMNIIIAPDGKHSYDFEYTLPKSD
jgi:uncharacterized protein DUF3224